jgi:hypothetical protein
VASLDRALLHALQAMLAADERSFLGKIKIREVRLRLFVSCFFFFFDDVYFCFLILRLILCVCFAFVFLCHFVSALVTHSQVMVFFFEKKAFGEAGRQLKWAKELLQLVAANPSGRVCLNEM